MKARSIGAALFAAIAGAVPITAPAQQGRFPLPAPDWPSPVHDDPIIPFVLLERLEYRAQREANVRTWDVQGWIGSDYNKLWIKSEGAQKVGGRTEGAEAQALYARLLSPFWYLQTGVRTDVLPHPTRNNFVLAVQGLAPYWFNIEASAFIGQGGKLAGRLEANYDFLITQRLILQPRAEINFAVASDATRGAGEGIRNVDLGVRLRYEFSRQFAPYIGVNWTAQMGETADLARARGERAREHAVVLGVRVWF